MRWRKGRDECETFCGRLAIEERVKVTQSDRIVGLNLPGVTTKDVLQGCDTEGAVQVGRNECRTKLLYFLFFEDNNLKKQKLWQLRSSVQPQ